MSHRVRFLPYSRFSEYAFHSHPAEFLPVHSKQFPKYSGSPDFHPNQPAHPEPVRQRLVPILHPPHFRPENRCKCQNFPVLLPPYIRHSNIWVFQKSPPAHMELSDKTLRSFSHSPVHKNIPDFLCGLHKLKSPTHLPIPGSHPGLHKSNTHDSDNNPARMPAILLLLLSLRSPGHAESEASQPEIQSLPPFHFDIQCHKPDVPVLYNGYRYLKCRSVSVFPFHCPAESVPVSV